jgi:hypothetical protein
MFPQNLWPLSTEWMVTVSKLEHICKKQREEANQYRVMLCARQAFLGLSFSMCIAPNPKYNSSCILATRAKRSPHPRELEL